MRKPKQKARSKPRAGKSFIVDLKALMEDLLKSDIEFLRIARLLPKRNVRHERFLMREIASLRKELSDAPR